MFAKGGMLLYLLLQESCLQQSIIWCKYVGYNLLAE